MNMGQSNCVVWPDPFNLINLFDKLLVDLTIFFANISNTQIIAIMSSFYPTVFSFLLFSVQLFLTNYPFRPPPTPSLQRYGDLKIRVCGKDSILLTIWWKIHTKQFENKIHLHSRRCNLDLSVTWECLSVRYLNLR